MVISPRFFRNTALLALTLLLAGCTAVPRPAERDAYDPECLMGDDAIRVPLLNSPNRQWRVQAEVDGVTGLFILDTGAKETVITPQFAGRIAGYNPSRENAAAARNGAWDRKRFCKLTYLRMGDAAYLDFFAPVMNLDHVSRALGTEVAGILGNNVLNKTAYELDWRQNWLTLRPRSCDAPPGALPVSVRQNRVYVKAEINGQPIELALDTGAYRSLLSKSDQARLKIPRDKITLVEAPRIDFREARLLKQARVELDSLNLGPIARTNYSVLTWNHSVLGMDLLEPWVLRVDARRGWMSLTR